MKEKIKKLIFIFIPIIILLLIGYLLVSFPSFYTEHIYPSPDSGVSSFEKSIPFHVTKTNYFFYDLLIIGFAVTSVILSLYYLLLNKKQSKDIAVKCWQLGLAFNLAGAIILAFAVYSICHVIDVGSIGPASKLAYVIHELIRFIPHVIILLFTSLAVLLASLRINSIRIKEIHNEGDVPDSKNPSPEI